MALLLEPSPYDARTRGLMLAQLSPRVRFAVKLYFRCQMFNEIALPGAGGVLDQNEFLVSMLETVHNNVLAIRAEQMEGIYGGPRPATKIEGVDARVTESIQIGKQYQKRRTIR